MASENKGITIEQLEDIWSTTLVPKLEKFFDDKTISSAHDNLLSVVKSMDLDGNKTLSSADLNVAVNKVLSHITAENQESIKQLLIPVTKNAAVSFGAGAAVAFATHFFKEFGTTIIIVAASLYVIGMIAVQRGVLDKAELKEDIQKDWERFKAMCKDLMEKLTAKKDSSQVSLDDVKHKVQQKFDLNFKSPESKDAKNKAIASIIIGATFFAFGFTAYKKLAE